ncbi:hypothetical protein D3C75_923780 [compost metagenome]
MGIGEGEYLGDALLATLVEHTGGARLALDLVDRDTQLVVATEGKHEALGAGRAPVRGADVAAVSEQLRVAGQPDALRRFGLGGHHRDLFETRRDAQMVLGWQRLPGQADRHLAAIGRQADRRRHHELAGEGAMVDEGRRLVVRLVAGSDGGRCGGAGQWTERAGLGLHRRHLRRHRRLPGQHPGLRFGAGG